MTTNGGSSVKVSSDLLSGDINRQNRLLALHKSLIWSPLTNQEICNKAFGMWNDIADETERVLTSKSACSTEVDHLLLLDIHKTCRKAVYKLILTGEYDGSRLDLFYHLNLEIKLFEHLFKNYWPWPMLYKPAMQRENLREWSSTGNWKNYQNILVLNAALQNGVHAYSLKGQKIAEKIRRRFWGTDPRK